jgi:integrase
MQRAAHLLVVLNREENRLMKDATTPGTPLSAEQIKVMLSELLRNELGRIISEQDRGAEDIDALDARIAQLEAHADAIRHAARQNDFSDIELAVRRGAEKFGVALPDALPPALGRRAADLLRELHALEARALDGFDARTEAEPLVARHSALPVDDFVENEPVLLSAAWEKTFELYPSKSMRGNLNAIGKLATAFFGDIPVSMLTKDRQKAFFVWASRLPRSHGKTHGKNRFHPLRPKTQEAKYSRTKSDEIAEADAHDELVMEEIRWMDGLSDSEKRALLADRLVPRLTFQTLHRYRDSLNRLFRAAEELGCGDVPQTISYVDVQRAVNAAAPDDELYVRVTKSKIRMPWSEEHLAAFLTGPLYSGCASPSRRWKPGNAIIRDAFYWVPLIVLTIGSRIEEVLLLKRKNIILRNGVHCFALNRESDQKGKTEDAQRVVPVPQLLLDLGFIEWWKTLDADHGPLLFPDAVSRASTHDVVGPFSKALNIILGHLGLRNFDEDFYAMRKTFSSMLNDKKVPENERQALAGHKRGSVINLHYTAHRTKNLKAAIDKADFQLEISFSEPHGFPVIAGCGLSTGDAIAVDVVLGEDGEAASVRVSKVDDGEDVETYDLVDPQTGEKLPPDAVLKVASRFRDRVDGHRLVLPKAPIRRQAVEHLHALG